MLNPRDDYGNVGEEGSRLVSMTGSFSRAVTLGLMGYHQMAKLDMRSRQKCLDAAESFVAFAALL